VSAYEQRLTTHGRCIQSLNPSKLGRKRLINQHFAGTLWPLACPVTQLHIACNRRSIS
jgi:hypothetical protein